MLKCCNPLRHGVWLACLLATATHAANDIVEAIAESKVFGYGKMMYVADDKKGGRPDQSTPGFGGQLGIETGALFRMRVRAAGYTTQDLGLRSDNPRKTDAYLFDLDKTPYTLLGQAQLIGSWDRTTLRVGRQEIDSPLISSYEYRIIPNLFEAVHWENHDLSETTLTLAYVAKMSGLDGLTTFSQFRSMSEQAYTSLMVTPADTIDAVHGETLVPSRIVGDRGVWLAGVAVKHPYALSLWSAYGADLIHTLYADGQFHWPLDTVWRLIVDAQAYRVSAVGQLEEYLSGHNLNVRYDLLGLKSTLAHKPSGLSVGAAFNRFGGDERTVTTFGNWGGYPEFVSMPYLFAEGSGVSAIARSRLAKLTAQLDLGPYGLTRHSLLLGHTRINLDERILQGSDIVVNSLIYRSQWSHQWSTRLALESRQSGNTRYDNAFVALALRYDF